MFHSRLRSHRNLSQTGHDVHEHVDKQWSQWDSKSVKQAKDKSVRSASMQAGGPASERVSEWVGGLVGGWVSGWVSE